MAVEIESQTVAWCQFGGASSLDPAEMFWKGQGIDSVTRLGVGSYRIDLTDELDPNDLFFLSVSGNLAGTVFPTQQVAIDSATQIRLENFAIAGVGNLDSHMWGLHVVRFNVEAPRQVVS